MSDKSSSAKATIQSAPGVTTETEPLGNTELAYEQVRQAIVEGVFQPGQRLIEHRVSEEFGLSRTPIREAFRRLEAEGLLVTERHRGARVRDVSATDIHDIYELRATLEGLVASRAAERITPELLAIINGAADEFAASIPATDAVDVLDIRRLNAANEAFHSGLVTAAGHDRLANMLRRTVDIPLVFEALRQFAHEELQRSNLFHFMILDCVRQGEGSRASSLMQEHIYQGRDVLLESLGADGSAAGWIREQMPPGSGAGRSAG